MPACSDKASSAARSRPAGKSMATVCASARSTDARLPNETNTAILAARIDGKVGFNLLHKIRAVPDKQDTRKLEIGHRRICIYGIFRIARYIRNHMCEGGVVIDQPAQIGRESCRDRVCQYV